MSVVVQHRQSTLPPFMPEMTTTTSEKIHSKNDKILHGLLLIIAEDDMNEFKIKTLRLITTMSRCCPASFGLAHRRVFSYLAYRSRLGLGDSQRAIARQTVSDSRTTKSVLAFLTERKLVEHRNGKWHALEPTGENRDWFTENKNPKHDRHWSDRFCYSPLLIPRKNASVALGSEKRLTVNHAHVYSLLSSLGRANKEKPGVVEGIGVSRLSKILNGLSPKTIRSCLNVLGSLGLVICYQEGTYETIHVIPVSEQHVNLFEEAVPKQQSKESLTKAAQQEVRFKNEEMQSIYRECRREGFSIDLSKEITVAAAMAGIDSMAFDGYSELAAVEHAKNRLNGKVTVEHHGHLLKYKLDEVRNEHNRIDERMMASIGTAKPQPKKSDVPSSETVRQLNPLPETPKRSEPIGPSEDLIRRIDHDMVTTKAWLRHKLRRPATAADIVAATNDGRLAAWCMEGRVSPFFLAVSPQVRKVIDGKSLSDAFGPRCACEYTPAIVEAIVTKYGEVFADLMPGDKPVTDVNVVEDPELDEEIIEGMTRRQMVECLAGL